MRFAIITLFLFVMFIFVHTVDAAIIHGTVYDMNLDPAVNSIVKINTNPQQSIVSKNGLYSFEVPNGEYTLEAMCEPKKRKCHATENVTVSGDGNYILDMILFPDLSDEEELIDEIIEIDSGLIEDKTNGSNWIFFTMTIIIAILVSAVIFVIFRKKPEKKKARIDADNDDDLTEKIISFLKKEGGRSTQKEIRKLSPLSEAKISLILTDLEDKKMIRKIKKGKGNVIVLEKKD